MKTKFVKISVQERLPDKSGKYQIITKKGNFKHVGFSGSFVYEPFYEEEEIEFWLEEVPDREEEMKGIIENLLSLKDVKDKYGKSPNYEEMPKAWAKAKQLLNELKQQ